MKSHSYFRKFTDSRDANGPLNERALLDYLESLNEVDWGDLLAHVLSDRAEAYDIFNPGKGDVPVSCLEALVRRLGTPARMILSSAVERLVVKSVTSKATETAERALIFAAHLPGPELVSFLSGAITNRDFSASLRELAADALAARAGDVPATLWTGLDFETWPELAPSAIAALAPVSAAAAIEILLRLDKPQSSEAFEYPLRIAVRKLIAVDSSRLLRLVEHAAGWQRALLERVLSFDEFRHFMRADANVLIQPRYEAPSNSPALYNDLNNIATVITLRVESMSQLVQGDRELEKHVEDITTAVGRISRIVDELQGRPSEAQPSVPNTPEIPSLDAASPAPPATILLVDDEALVRKASAAVLEKSGYTVIQASGGQAAIDAWEQLDELPAVLVTDVDMPHMNGQQLATELLERWAGLRVVFMSGLGEDVLKEISPVPGRIALLAKPFRFSDLAGVVARLLDEGTRAPAR